MKHALANIVHNGVAAGKAAALAMTLLAASVSNQARAQNAGFLSVQDNRLTLDGQVFDQPSTNMFDLSYLYLFDRPAGQLKLQQARQSGFRVVRFFAGGIYSESGVRFPAVDTWENPQTRSQFFAAFDAMLDDADSLGVKLVPALVTGVSDLSEAAGSHPCYSSPFSIALYPGSANRATMKAFALDIVQHYQARQGILFWELGNELNLGAKERNPALLCVTRQQIGDYISEMAQAIKAVDANHLVAGGAMQEGDTVWPLGDVPGAFNDAGDFFRFYNLRPGVDISGVHIYGQYGYHDGASQLLSISGFLDYFQTQAELIQKPLWIGEFGVPPGVAWSTNNYDDFVVSLLLARRYMALDLATVWNWESKQYTVGSSHPEMTQFSLDPGEDDDILEMLTSYPVRMGRDLSALSWTPLAADFDGDGRDDFLAEANRGLWQVSLMGATPNIPAQWLSVFCDDARDPGGSPFLPLIGDWNGDGRSDAGCKSKNGRWYVAYSDGKRFHDPALWLSAFGNDYADGGAPFEPFAGDWNGDGKTDIGARTRDGRWYVAFSSGTGFTGTAQWASGLASELADPANAPYRLITGDWNGDLKTDVGVKTRDGRWLISLNTGSSFAPATLALSGFANDGADPAGAPFLPFTGDWDGDGKTDIAVKSRDGRWYFASSNGASFVGARLALSNFGNNNVDGPFVPFSGDWNMDGKTDIGAKTSDGRWYVAYSNGNVLIGSRIWH